MKKLLFGLIAVFMFSTLSFGQTKITKEEARVQFANSMSELVTQCKPSYKSGMTYDDFIRILLGGNSTIPTQEGKNLMQAAYSFISKGASSNEIIKNYNGIEMAAIANLIKDTKSASEAGIKIFGSKIINETPFGQSITSNKAACWICGALQWIWDNHDEIIRIICIFIC